jgi:hypothetical protein
MEDGTKRTVGLESQTKYWATPKANDAEKRGDVAHRPHMPELVGQAQAGPAWPHDPAPGPRHEQRHGQSRQSKIEKVQNQLPKRHEVSLRMVRTAQNSSRSLKLCMQNHVYFPCCDCVKQS